MHHTAIIIDDDPISVLVCETLLKKTGFAEQVHSFSNGEKALAYFTERYARNEGLPDIIFLDVIMPVMDGWEFLEAYEALKNLPEISPHIVMLSAAFDPRDKEKAENSPLISEFISKPITKEILEEMTAAK